jgi:hypothetical protein
MDLELFALWLEMRERRVEGLAALVSSVRFASETG